MPHPRWTRRSARWLFRLCMAALIFLILVLVDNFSLAFSFLDKSAPSSPKPHSDATLFYFQTLPGWSTLTIDGQPLADIPRQGSHTPLALRKGQHTLTWQAEPFTPFQCTLAIPPQQTADACKLQELSETQPAYLIVLPVSLQRLPEEQRNALITATQAALDTRQVTETVHRGEHYAFSPFPAHPLVAQGELSATRRLLLHTDLTQPAHCNGLSLGQGCTIADQDCRSFCPMNVWPILPAAASRWQVAALFYETWEYTVSDGQHLSPPQAQEERLDQFVTLDIGWEGGHWTVAFHTNGESTFDDPLCTTVASLLLHQARYQQVQDQRVSVSWTFVSHPPQTASCLGAGYVRPDTATSQPDKPSAALLYRFGVLLAANDVAHRLWPDLPPGDPTAQQLARQMMRKAQL